MLEMFAKICRMLMFNTVLRMKILLHLLDKRRILRRLRREFMRKRVLGKKKQLLQLLNRNLKNNKKSLLKKQRNKNLKMRRVISRSNIVTGKQIGRAHV